MERAAIPCDLAGLVTQTLLLYAGVLAFGFTGEGPCRPVDLELCGGRNPRRAGADLSVTRCDGGVQDLGRDVRGRAQFLELCVDPRRDRGLPRIGQVRVVVRELVGRKGLTADLVDDR